MAFLLRATPVVVVGPGAVNLFAASEAFDSASWTKTGSTITANATAAPGGAVTADKLAETATTTVHRVEQTIQLAAATNVCVSVYAKAAERTLCAIRITPGTGGTIGTSYYNLSTGAVAQKPAAHTSGATPEANGYYRIAAGVASAAGPVLVAITTIVTAGTTSFAGAAGSGVYLWGAQFESGTLTPGVYSATA